MELRDYLNILVKRLWAVIVIPLLAAAFTAAVNIYVIEPIYVSSNTLYIRMPYDDFLDSQVIKNCRELIKSKLVTKEVIDRLDIGLTPEELAEKITVSPINDTQFVRIEVADKDGERAKMIADEINVVLQYKIRDLIDIEGIIVVDKAEIPSAPDFPKPYSNMAAVYFAALLL